MLGNEILHKTEWLWVSRDFIGITLFFNNNEKRQVYNFSGGWGLSE